MTASPIGSWSVPSLETDCRAVWPLDEAGSPFLEVVSLAAGRALAARTGGLDGAVALALGPGVPAEHGTTVVVPWATQAGQPAEHGTIVLVPVPVLVAA